MSRWNTLSRILLSSRLRAACPGPQRNPVRPLSVSGHQPQQHHLPLISGAPAASASRRWASAFSGAPPPSGLSEDPLGSALLDLVTYEAVCADTLDSLCEYFDQLVESAPHLKYADITFSDGVLTVQFGGQHGTYVINRQSPNRQIWLSSPTSGPKRYDFVPTSHAAGDDAGGDSNLRNGHWVYKHDGVTLHQLLQLEIAPIVRAEVDFLGLPFGSKVAEAK